MRDDGSQAGVNEEVSSGIRVAPPEADPHGGGGGGSGGGPKGWRVDFI